MKKYLILFSALCFSQIALAKGVQVHDAYARATVSGMKQTGAFLSLDNTDNQNNALVGVDIAPTWAASAELHTHINDNGVMRMRQINQIPLPAKQTVALKQGGYHIMFFDVKREWKAGQKVPITLKFQNGGNQRVWLEVKALDAPMSSEHHHQHGEGHVH